MIWYVDGMLGIIKMPLGLDKPLQSKKIPRYVPIFFGIFFSVENPGGFYPDLDPTIV